MLTVLHTWCTNECRGALERSRAGPATGGLSMALVTDEELARDVDSFFSTNRTSAPTAGPYLRWTVALASFGAAALHFAFAPGHFSEYWAHGTFFVVVAWLQLVWGIGMLVTRSRSLLLLGLLNAAVIGVWIVSRTVGVPIGPGSGTAEAVGFPDTLSTVLEGLIVLGSAVMLWKPSIGRRPLRPNSFVPGLAVAGAIALVAATTASLTPRYGGEHHHGVSAAAAGGGTGGHSHGVATGGAATGAATGAAAGNHSHAASSTVLTGDSPCEKSGPPASEGQTQGEGHNHRGPSPQKPLTRDERILLAQQQDLARAVALRYPTVADAVKGRYFASTTYIPCIGAHYTNTRYAVKFDPSNPSELLYDGTAPDSKIVGLSYLVFSPQGPPEGFAGPNDFWHTHSSNGGLCIKGIVIGAESMSKAECERLGGRKVGLKGVYMMHDWIVPGWECSWGVFAGECPELGGNTGKDAWTSS